MKLLTMKERKKISIKKGIFPADICVICGNEIGRDHNTCHHCHWNQAKLSLLDELEDLTTQGIRLHIKRATDENLGRIATYEGIQLWIGKKRKELKQ